MCFGNVGLRVECADNYRDIFARADCDDGVRDRAVIDRLRL